MVVEAFGVAIEIVDDASVRIGHGEAAGGVARRSVRMPVEHPGVEPSTSPPWACASSLN